MQLKEKESPFLKRFMRIAIISIVIILIALATFAIFRRKHPNNSPNQNILSYTGSSTKAKTLFGTMLAFNINDAMANAPDQSAVLQQGWAAYRKTNSDYEGLKSNLRGIIQDHSKLVETTEFSLDRELAPYFTWNVIEPQKGQFDWGLTDIYTKGATSAGVKISAVIQPFAAWDQENTQVNTSCKMLDAAYHDYKAGPPNDISEYENFLTKTVDRYKDNVAVWEIGNEPDANCNGYQNNPDAYFNLLKVSSETIKKADPKALVVNGGASGHSNNSNEKNFWTKFFQLGGGQYIDYFNLHYNTERSQDAKLNSGTFEEELMFWNGLMDDNGARKPLYLTEFGIYSGSSPAQLVNQFPVTNQPVAPSGNLNQNGRVVTPPSAGQSLPVESLDAQAAMYFKDSIVAFANGTNFVFIDLIGSDNNLVGSSAEFNIDGRPRLFLTGLKTVMDKISGFIKVTKITDGQYKFTANNRLIYALWSGNLPAEISGRVKVTDINGQEQTLDATGIQFGTDQPVIVESQ